MALVVILSGFLIPADRLFAAQTGPGAFYRIVPYAAMVVPALALFFYGILIWSRGTLRFWSETRNATAQTAGVKATVMALADALALRYLKGGGPGCTYPEESPRRHAAFTTPWCSGGFSPISCPRLLPILIRIFSTSFRPTPCLADPWYSAAWAALHYSLA